MADLIAKETLRKARYFLELARAAEADPAVLTNRLPFVANLEAAIVYARSSLDHLQTEMSPAHNAKGYRRWHDRKWQSLTASSAMFKGFTERRNIIIHQKPETTRAHVTAEANLSLGVSVSVGLTVTRADGRIENYESDSPKEPPKRMEAAQGKTSQVFFFADSDWSDKPAIAYVADFIAECEGFVVEADQRFS